MRYHTKLTFKIFWQHAMRYKLAGFLVIFSIAAGSVTNVIGPLIYKEFFDVLVDSTDIAATSQLLVQIIFKVFMVYMIGWVFWRFATFVNSYFQTKVMADLANTCFGYLHKHSFSFFQNNFVGSLVKKVNRFYRSFEGIADALTWELLPLVTEVAVIIIVLGQRNYILSLIIIGWIIVYCFINYFFSIYKLKYDIERSKMDTRVTGLLADTITNYSNVKLLSGYGKESASFEVETGRLQKLRRFTWDLGNIFESVQVLLMIFLEFGIFYFAIKLWTKGAMSVGDFVLIQAYLLTIFHKLWNFGKIIRHFYERLADAEEMTVVLDMPHEIKDTKRAKQLEVTKGKIEFDNVNFYYHRTRRVIDSLNLKIKPGERIALIGPSGAGKSTIVKLLLRQHDIASGKVLVDGQRISRVTQESLWGNISLVPQDPLLFHRTLLENIRYGKQDASDEEVVRAARLAHCHEFINEFPDTYDTYVGERGVKLSGGERQRVAIARAILKDAPILVLDEATSSLDSESELLIQDALDTLMKKKTVIVIAHRLSTIMKMDRILVVDRGTIVESGTHKGLLKKKNGIYRKLWKLQAGGFLN